MNDEKLKRVNRVQAELKRLYEFKVDGLVSRPELGVIDFRASRDLIEQAINLSKELIRYPLEELTDTQLEQLYPPFANLANKMQEISQFNLDDATDPKALRDQLETELKKLYEVTNTKVQPVLPYLAWKHVDMGTTIEKAQNLLDNAVKTSEATIKTLKIKTQELDDAVQAARKATASIGVGQFTSRFEELSKNHHKSARVWLGATVLAAMITITASLFLPWAINGDPITLVDGEARDLLELEIISKGLSKFVVISVLYFLTIWTSRNYKTHRHLKVVNEHRQTALTTFETFVTAAEDDEETKNAVLLEATRSVFAHVNTGYVAAEEDTSPNRIVEILKTRVGGG